MLLFLAVMEMGAATSPATTERAPSMAERRLERAVKRGAGGRVGADGRVGAGSTVRGAGGQVVRVAGALLL